MRFYGYAHDGLGKLGELGPAWPLMPPNFVDLPRQRVKEDTDPHILTPYDAATTPNTIER